MRRWLFADWGLKLGAVLLGGCLWLYAVSGHPFNREFAIPLKVADPANPTGGSPIVLASPPPSTVRVVVKGVGMDLLRTSASDLELSVTPRSRELGTLTVRLREDQVKINTEYDIVVERVVEPRELSLQVDRRAERSVPVRPRVGLRIADAYTQVGGVRVSPDSVRMVGPASQVRSVDAIETDSLYEEDLRADIDRMVAVRPPAETMIRLLTGEVRVTIDVQELAEYEIPEVPVAVRGGPEGAGVSPARVTVRVRGGADLIGALDPETDLGLYVEYAAGRHPIRVPGDRLYEVRQIVPAEAEVLLPPNE